MILYNLYLALRPSCTSRNRPSHVSPIRFLINYSLSQTLSTTSNFACFILHTLHIFRIPGIFRKNHNLYEQCLFLNELLVVVSGTKVGVDAIQSPLIGSGSEDASSIGFPIDSHSIGRRSLSFLVAHCEQSLTERNRFLHLYLMNVLVPRGS